MGQEERGRVDAGGLDMAWARWPGAGPALVALHGITASSASFVGLGEALAGRRALLALDLRGRGDTEKPDGPYGMDTHAGDVAAAMEALGLGPSVVVGHSMGAFVAAALAAAHSERVAGLVLIDGGLPLNTPPGVPLEQLLEAALSMQVGRLRRVFASEAEYTDFWKAQAPFSGGRWNDWVEHYVCYDLRPVDGGWQPKASEAAVRADSIDTADAGHIRSRLRAIRAPVLLLRAEEGFNPGDPPLFPDDLTRRELAGRANFTDRVIPGSTHYTITLGRAQAVMVAEAVVAFAQGCGR